MKLRIGAQALLQTKNRGFFLRLERVVDQIQERFAINDSAGVVALVVLEHRINAQVVDALARPHQAGNQFLEQVDADRRSEQVRGFE